VPTFGRMVRTSCTECGGSSLSWMTALDLVFKVPFRDREDFFRIIGFTGFGAEAWKCNDCEDGAGVFSPQDFVLP